ncbi:AraC family transcriptional regulator [Bacteroides sedimenti]|uniref:XylR family transcriptional regulator n=1 Tax=Bacteroides sedimenti TaxID=2136147 RepID=A0ABM8IB53_9BACE
MIRLIQLTDFTEAYAQYLQKGIITYSKEHDPWVVCRMPPAFKLRYGIEGVIDWAKKWEADAIVAQFDEDDNVGLFRQNGIVAVAQDFKTQFKSIPNITGDYELGGKMAADFFLQKGYQNFAFVGYKNAIWSEKRCQGFYDRISEFGFEKNFHVFQNKIIEELWFYEQNPLIEWLKSLPKPIALMTCDDTQGNKITEICRICNLRIPEDISLIGVDNDEMTCNLSDPTLSSVALDVEKGGYETAKLIDKMVTSQNYEDFEDVVIHHSHIVQRQSTNMYPINDKEIAMALKYIDDNINSKINVDDIVKVVPLSRRLLEIRFKHFTKMSVYQYVMLQRINRFARSLLTSTAPICELAIEMGFSDFKNLSRQFKTIKGCPPHEYRKEHTLKNK